MRQVPQYCIIGNGLMAKHMTHYLEMSQLPFTQWHRNCSTSLSKASADSSHVLILISDQAIDPFIKKNPCLHNSTLVHFSGALLSEYAHTAHPLCTFSKSLYSLVEYKRIAFIIEKEGPSFHQLLPGLTNNHHRIFKQQKQLYHSLCVMANNFTTLLWQKFFKECEQQLNIPQHSTLPFLKATFNNIEKDYINALTGPLARNDHTTLQNNMKALEGDSYQSIFNAFLTAYNKEKGKENEYT